MANEAFVRVKQSDLENLHRLTDKVEERLDADKSSLEDISKRLANIEAGKVEEFGKEDLVEVRSSLQGANENIRIMRERLDALDKMLPRGEKIYRSPGAEEAGAKAAEARREFAALIFDQGLIARRAKPRFSSFYREQSEVGTGGATLAEGGVLLAEEFRPEIVRLIETYGVARRFCRVLPMATKDFRIPFNDTLPNAYWEVDLDGSDVELVAPSESQVTFGDRTMSAKKLMAIDTLSIELIDDAIPAVADFIIDLFAIAFAKKEDEACFTMAAGGGSQFTDGGLLNESGIAEITTRTGVNAYNGEFWTDTDQLEGAYVKLLNVLDACDEAVSNTGAWVMSNSMVNGLRLVRDTTNQPLWANMIDPTGTQLFGRPLLRSRVMPKQTDAGDQSETPFILYGDGTYKIMGDRKQLSVDVSEHAAFTRYGMVLRVVERVGFKTILKTAFSRLKTAA